jgi:threonine synthase
VRYVSTRGAAQPKGFTEILLEGLASDGGLYVPEAYPRVDLKSLRGKAYPALALEILSRFMDDVPDLRSIVDRRIRRKCSAARTVTPLRTLEPGLHLLGISNGPTLAFKDIAMQLLGPLFERTLAAHRTTLTILGATSGDTGSAAEHAMKGRSGIDVFMLSPHGRMSAFQRAQMYALQDSNIHNLAVKGTFDDCQRVVKQVNADAAFKSRYRIGAVNSINWARVAAQAVYYFRGYFAATRTDDELVTFAVPSGNFGNIYAGHVARSMGLPIKRLVLATNENNVLENSSAPAITACAAPRSKLRARRWTSRARRTSSAMCSTSSAAIPPRCASSGQGSIRRASSTSRRFPCGSRNRVSSRASARMRTGSRRSAESSSVRRDGGSAHGGRNQRRAALSRAGRADDLPRDGAAREVRRDDPRGARRDPGRPQGLENLEALPQRFEVIEPDAEAVKRIIARGAS